MTSPLLGPPELLDSNLILPDPITASASSNPSMLSSPQTGRGQTENGSDTYLSTGNPCLDFFFHIVPSTPKESLEQRLQAAWNHDALTTIKLIANLRGVRGTGKSDKEGFYTASLWLHATHPKTLACNLDALSEFGYFKDFPELLYRILQGSEIRKIQKSEWNQKHIESRVKPKAFRRGRGRAPKKGKASKKKPEPEPEPVESRELRIAKAAKRNEEEKAKFKLDKLALAKKAFTRYSEDQDYRFLFEKVSDLFADYLKKDLELLYSNETYKISLAAKWCPSLDSSFDKATLLCESIAKKLFPRESFPEYEGVEEAHYAYRVRDRLRKQVLVPLRKNLQLPEVYMGARDWESLPYNRVASVAMKTYKSFFLSHDKERFQQYLQDAREGKTKVAAGALLPHEIIRGLNYGGEVEELQWKRMVDDLKTKGSLTNCIAISDVSGSMYGEPMEVSVALGLLVSELSEEPWKGKLITFSKNPELHFVEGEDLKSKTRFVKEMKWNMNTDFQKVFDVILKVAVEGKLKAEEMIKRIFVFSDMEFDKASTSTSWETDYEMIVRKFGEKGYGEVVPQIVFWNLRDSRSTPVMEGVKGVALVSGFSKNMITLFLERDGDTREIDPVEIMEKAISGDEYKKFAVYSATGEVVKVVPMTIKEDTRSGDESKKLEVVPMIIKEDTRSGDASKKLALTGEIDLLTIKGDSIFEDESKSLAKTGEIDTMAIKEDIIISGDIDSMTMEEDTISADESESGETDPMTMKEDSISGDESEKFNVHSESEKIDPMTIKEDTISGDESKKKLVEPRGSSFSDFPKFLLVCFFFLVASFLMQMFLYE